MKMKKIMNLGVGSVGSVLGVVSVSLVLLSSLNAAAANGQGHKNAASPELIQARQHFFGAENVDPVSGKVRADRVIFSWFSTTSFAVALRGRVFLLDAFIDRREDGPGRTGTTLQELVALAPEAIFIGHGHFDHMDLAGYLAAVTGATLVAAPEHCDQARLDAIAALGPDATVRCLDAVSRDSLPGEEVNHLSLLKPDACVTAFRHVHSASVPPDPDFPPNPVPLPGPQDDREALLFPPGPPPSDGVLGGCGGACGSLSLFYQFVIPAGRHNFTFAWHNTIGPLKEQAPEILDLLRQLPKTDIQFGSIASSGFATNSVRDAVMYIQAIQPKVYVPTHLGFSFLGIPSTAPFWKLALEAQFEIMGVPEDERPELRWLYDPWDYIRPQLFTFDYKDDRWSATPPGRAGGKCSDR